MYSTIKILNICRLNRSSKVCLKRVPLATRVHRQAHFPNPNFFSNVYCPVATRFQNPSSWAHSKFWTGPFDLVLFYYYLMNIVAALPAARSSSPLIAARRRRAKFFLKPFSSFRSRFDQSHSFCLVIGTCYCEVIFTLIGDDTSLWILR